MDRTFLITGGLCDCKLSRETWKGGHDVSSYAVMSESMPMGTSSDWNHGASSGVVDLLALC